MGSTDRFIRILVAFIVLMLVYLNIISGIAGIVLLVISGIFIITGVIGICPLYSLFKFNTGAQKKPTG